MAFTLKALLPPFVCFVLLGLMMDHKYSMDTIGPLGLVVMLWGFLAFGATVVYWIARIWKRVTRDTPDTHLYR